MKKVTAILSVAIVVGIAAFFLARNSAGSAAPERPLIIGFENDVPTFDPLALGNVFALRVGSQVFEGLTRLDENNQIGRAHV